MSENQPDVTTYTTEAIAERLRNVDTLFRRPEGQRKLVYLDQSTLSSLALDADHSELLALLDQAVRAEQIVCVGAPEHEDESLAAPQRGAIQKMRRTLSMGIEFLGWQEILWNEARWIAAEFVDETPDPPGWEEAFYKDPQSPRDSLYPGGFQVSVDMGTPEWRVESVENQKNLELTLDSMYEIDRAKGWSFETLSAAFFNDMVNIHMRPMFDYATYAEMFMKAGDAAFGDPFNVTEENLKQLDLLLDLKLMKERSEQLIADFPRVKNDPLGYKLCLAGSPMIAIPALLRAAIVSTPGRKAKRGDGFDIKHLANALSRCDFATCDGGMAQLCRNFKIVPSGCQLFSFRERHELMAALESAIG